VFGLIIKVAIIKGNALRVNFEKILGENINANNG